MAGGCFLAGAMTVLHPCPLTSNLAALSLITAWAGRMGRAIGLGSAYAGGYVLVYCGLGVLFGALGTGIDEQTQARDLADLAGWLDIVLGPLFIVIGMVQVGLIKLPDWSSRNRRLKAVLQRREWNLGGAFVLGLVLALAFCPATGALFLGLLLPAILQDGRWLLLPALFGLGAALPLVLIAVALIRGVGLLDGGGGRWWRRLPIIAGWLLIAAGAWLSLQNLEVF